MAYQSIWYYTSLSDKVVDAIEEDAKTFFENDQQLQDSRIGGGFNNGLDGDVRKGKNAWIPDTHWISGFLWHYVMKANKENFLYDLTGIDGGNLQYTIYNEGNHYTWHQDAGISSYTNPAAPNNGQNRADPNILIQDFATENIEQIRKLSFSLQLSEPDEYEGGQFQLLDEQNRSYIAPRQRGTLILFDSRAMHRVRKVTKGTRKSIVGWCVGPRWR